MIEASFEPAKSRSAAVSGVYQYDTGQRLRMLGLPSPEEFLEMDELLADDSKMTVRAQFAFVGDSQTEERIAEYDGTAWVTRIPDVYLQESADVHLYVYVSHGSTEESMRAKTVYEAVFRPIPRPAPNTGVTPDQTNAWEALVQEVNIAIAGTKTATSNANAEANRASDAAAAANEAARKAIADVNTYLSFLGRTDVKVKTINDPYAEAKVDVEDKTDEETGEAYKLLTITLPQSVVTVNDQAADGKGNIVLTHEHVGAMPATHQTVFEFTATIPANMNGSEGVAVNVAGVLAADRPVVDIDMAVVEEEDREVTLEAWANILRINALDGGIGIIYAGETSVAIPIRLLCVR